LSSAIGTKISLLRRTTRSSGRTWSSKKSLEQPSGKGALIPEGEKCFCLFEGESREAVEEVQHRAGIPFEKIHDAAFLTAADV
jgi:hypothetical protein